MIFVDESTYKKEIGIYKITNLVNGMVYIGQTGQNFQRRYWLHQWKLRDGTHDNKYLQRAWNKYGEEGFEFSVVEITTKDKLNDKEIYWIDYFRNGVGCYSIQDGGKEKCLVKYVSAASRKLVGEKNREHMLGRKATDKTKKKMSETRTGLYVPRKNNSLTLEQVFKIKTMLVDGFTPKEIMNELGIEYKPINGLISRNHYAYVKVDGWDDFLRNRPKGKGKPSVGRKSKPSK